MKKHLKHQENAFPATNHYSGHFRPIYRPNYESSKNAKYRDFGQKIDFQIFIVMFQYHHIWSETGPTCVFDMFKHIYLTLNIISNEM